LAVDRSAQVSKVTTGDWKFETRTVAELAGMELQQFQELLALIRVANPDAESAYLVFFDSAPADVILLHIENSLVLPETPTHDMSIVLFGRALSVLCARFLELGDASFHESVQRAMLMLLSNTAYSLYSRDYVSSNIAKLSNIYAAEGLWQSLRGNLIDLIQQPDPTIVCVAIHCLSECINNKSLLVDDLTEEIDGLVRANLVESCDPQVLVELFRLVYSLSSVAAPINERIIHLIPLLPSHQLDLALSDFRQHFSENAGLVGAESAPVFVDVLGQISASEEVSVGSRVCAIESFGAIIFRFPAPFRPRVAEIVDFLFELLCSPIEEVSDEVGCSLEAVSRRFGGDMDFNTECVQLFEAHIASPTSESAMKIGAFRLMEKVLSNSVAFLSIGIADELWATALVGLGHPERAVREAAFRFAGTFFDVWTHVFNDFDAQAAVGPFLEAIGRENEVLEAELAALEKLCILLRGRLREVVGDVLGLLLPLLQQAGDRQKALVVRIVRGVTKSVKMELPGFAQFCAAVVLESSCREVFLECLKTLAVLPDASQEVTQSILEQLLAFLAADVEVSFVNDLLRHFIKHRQECADENFAAISGLVLAKIFAEFDVAKLPMTAARADLSSSLTVTLREENAILCYDSQKLSDLAELLRTLAAFLESTFCERFEEAFPHICEALLGFLDYPIQSGLLLAVLNVFKGLCAAAPLELTSPILAKSAERIVGIRDIELFTTAVERFCEAFERLADRFPDQSLCNTAVSAFLAFAEKSDEFLSTLRDSFNELEDVRDPHLWVEPLGSAISPIMETVFEKYGNRTSVPWHEQIQLCPTSLICLNVWTLFFVIIEPRDEVFAYVVACLQSVDGFGYSMAGAALSNLSLIVERGAPLPGPLLEMTIEHIRQLQAGDASYPMKGLAGAVCAMMMFVYDVKDAEVLRVALAWPIIWTNNVDLALLGESLAHLLMAFWDEILDMDPEIPTRILRTMHMIDRARGCRSASSAVLELLRLREYQSPFQISAEEVK
jgi:hypothetical protein